MQSVNIQDGRPRTVSFITDANGQVLQRDEVDNKSTGDPRELHYYFNGLKVGDISNNGTSDVDYVTSMAQHIAIPGTGPFRNGSASSTSYADFDQSYDPINGLNYEGTSSRYTVQAGDTLEAIALQVWGDASFWYLIADANGLDGTEPLAAGMSLVIPNKVHNAHNNAGTYRVYDPNEAIGDTAPTVPKVKKNKCGAFGQFIMVAIAVAVTVLSKGTLTAAFTSAFTSTATMGAAAAATAGAIAGATTAGALGSIAAQGFGIATGIQNKFSFKDVALAAVSAGIGGGGIIAILWELYKAASQQTVPKLTVSAELLSRIGAQTSEVSAESRASTPRKPETPRRR